MIGTIVKHGKDKIEVTMMVNDDVVRKVVVKMGNEYIINPINPRRTKHRDRKVIFKGMDTDMYKKYEPRAKVQFLDTKKIVKVDIGDLDYFKAL
jgi:hypothetical protein